MDQILSMIGLALRGSMVEIGEEPVGSVARAKKARVILVAQDAAASSVRRAASFARSGNCPMLMIDADKDALGRSLGRTSCAMCAVTDMGFASAIVGKLAILDPARYESVSEELSAKAQRFAQRKKEKKQHEKNIRTGKKKVAEPVQESPKPAEAVAETRSSRPATTRKTTGTRTYEKKRTDNRERYANSRPVKKGKGSKK